MRRRLSLAAMGVCALLVSAACGLGDRSGGQQVGVTLDEYHVKLDQNAASPGKVTFKVHNVGNEKHEFVILRTNIDVDSLPIGDDRKVKEETSGIEHISEIDGVPTGQEKSLTADLKPGSYLFICNIPGHVHQGMTALFSVR